jgi:hypothetical protein
MAVANTTLYLAVAVLALLAYFYMTSKSTMGYENAAVPASSQSLSAAPFAMSADASNGSASVSDSAALLPKDVNSAWTTNASGDGALSGVTLFKAGQMIGIQGNTLKNANLQIRSEPAIPKSNVGPWNQSTIESAPYLVCLELGCTKN